MGSFSLRSMTAFAAVNSGNATTFLTPWGFCATGRSKHAKRACGSAIDLQSAALAELAHAASSASVEKNIFIEIPQTHRNFTAWVRGWATRILVDRDLRR